MSYQPEGDENERRLMQAAQSIGRTLLSPGDTKREATRLLVEGWKMLGQTCPISEYPLFYNKKTGDVWSVRLQMPVRLSAKEENEFVEIETMETTGKKNAEPAVEATFHQVLQSKPAKSTRDLSKLIGEKLLLGWEMLNDHLDGCPILVDPSNGKKWLPSTEEYLSDEISIKPPSTLNDTEVARLSSHVENDGAQIDVEEEEPPNDDNSEIQISAETKDDSEISVRIAEKLLFGWEMLNESCPVTNSCPLMRDPKTGRKYSAALDAFVNSAKGNSDSENKKVAIRKGEALLTSQASSVSSASAKPDQINQSFSETNLKCVLELKLNVWTNDLRQENDLEICKRLLELIQQAKSVRDSLV